MSASVEPQRLMISLLISKHPGQAFHVEVAARRNHDSFDSQLRGDLSATRFPYWLNELLPEQLGLILREEVTRMWGDVLSNLPLDAFDVASWAQGRTV